MTGALAALGSVAVTPGASAQTEASYGYDVVAGSSGGRVGVAVEDFLLITQLVDVGSASAQAVVDGIGTSEAYAAYPYPGYLVAANPSYPFIAHSTSPTVPEAKVDRGGLYTLEARSEPTASAATAHGGLRTDDQGMGRTEATATATHDPAAGTVVAHSTSTTEALTFADVFRIGRVYAEAKVTDTPDGDPVVESKLEVGDMTVAGQRVVLTPEGLATPGSTVPLDGPSPVLEVLADNDIQVRYLAPAVEGGSVLSAGIEIKMRQPVPSIGTAVVTYTLGRASAAATIERFGGGIDSGIGGSDAGPAAGTGAPPAPGGSATVPEGDSSATTSSGPSASDIAPSNDGTQVETSDGAGGELAGGAAPGSPPGSGAGAVAVDGQLAASEPPDGSPLVGFYLVLVVCAVLALGGGQLIRTLGVKFSWS